MIGRAAVLLICSAASLPAYEVLRRRSCSPAYVSYRRARDIPAAPAKSMRASTP